MEILVDGREMQPPEPFERTMEALDALRPGDEVVLWLYRQPTPLFNVLKRNGYSWTEGTGPEQCFEYRIRPGK
ncbi:MAG: DUF2249 domain-containing protein [Rhodocyclaceae bacterium]|jgi:uncharacterized protein (DUF2249 family)|nr:DUF2249 domain-containing protein [Rhodocyclaceae bacterium]